MDLILDTSAVTFQVSKPFEARLDKDGQQRMDKQFGTNLPLWAVQLVAWTKDGAETILVTVAMKESLKVSQGQTVRLEGLRAMPWVSDGKAKVAFRAAAVVPASAVKSA